MIEFIKKTEKDEEGELTIHDVEENQFFIDNEDRLCQKVSDYDYNIIADSDGYPLACSTETMFDGDTITKVIDKIAKIKFE
jgi:hypothetical protein